MDDDLDTISALEALQQLGKQIEDAARTGRPVSAAQVELRKMVTVFGLRLGDDGPQARVAEGWGRHLARFT
jgi:hypothetical protein